MNIDLNADLGEGGPHDRDLLTLVSSANISCGAHAGTDDDIASAIHHALLHDVAIGAHPSYPDRWNFGRLPLDMTPAALRETLVRQLLELRQRVNAQGGALHHVKPHGALYNQAARDPNLARTVCEAVESVDGDLFLVGLSGSPFINIARERGLRVLEEVFADRRYTDDGALLPRSEPGAVLSSQQDMVRQCLALASGAGVTSTTGQRLKLRADTVCLHGDHPEALTTARQLRTILEKNNFSVCRPGH
ncbi:MAG: 5-oxoprolinase subunit PxpA [Pseudohongiellaceae bacterium]